MIDIIDKIDIHGRSSGPSRPSLRSPNPSAHSSVETSSGLEVGVAAMSLAGEPPLVNEAMENVFDDVTPHASFKPVIPVSQKIKPEVGLLFKHNACM